MVYLPLELSEGCGLNEDAAAKPFCSARAQVKVKCNSRAARGRAAAAMAKGGTQCSYGVKTLGRDQGPFTYYCLMHTSRPSARLGRSGYGQPPRPSYTYMDVHSESGISHGDPTDLQRGQAEPNCNASADIQRFKVQNEFK